MRVVSVWLLCLTACTLAAQWSTQDYEIFDVARALEKAEGANTTFYSFLNITIKATTDDISKAYRKRSLQLHPDKNHGVKNAQKRFERLGLIAKMLRTPDVRQRYDHFYRNGFPKWKGTGYFYSRYRPGVGAVLFLLFIVITAFHWLGMAITARSHRERINGHIRDAHNVAGYPAIAKRKRVTTETGRIFNVEPSGEVYLVQGSEEFLLSPDEVPSASFSRTLIYRMPVVLFRTTLGRYLISSEESSVIDDDSEPHAADQEVIKTIETTSSGESKTEKVLPGRKSTAAKKRN